MDISKLDTQGKIIATTIDTIGRQANLNFTIREIAEKAEVNLASVNYYFRSKDNLINEVERHFANEIQRLYDELDCSQANPEDKIRVWAEKIMEQLMEYPGIIFLLVTKLLNDRSGTEGIAGLIEKSEASLTPIIKELTQITDDTNVAIKVMQLLSGVIMPVLFYHGAGKTLNIDILSKENRVRYTEALVESVL